MKNAEHDTEWDPFADYLAPAVADFSDVAGLAALRAGARLSPIHTAR